MIKPFPKSLIPERKQMTIAIGMLAHDGLVIAADAEESTGDYMKGAAGKIACFYSQHGETGTFPSEFVDSCVISGAGNSGYVRALTDKLGYEFTVNAELPIHPMPAFGIAKEKVAKSLNPKLQNCLKTFYKEHIIPFASFPERKRPDVEMLIAIQRRNIRALFTTEKTVMNPSSPCKAVGLGSTFAELFLGKLWTGMSVEQAEILAAYIVFITKESVEGCGKFTTIVSIRGSQIVDTPNGSRMLPTKAASWLNRETIEGWEKSFRNQWWKAEQKTIFSLIGKEISKREPKPSTSQKSKGRR